MNAHCKPTQGVPSHRLHMYSYVCVVGWETPGGPSLSLGAFPPLKFQQTGQPAGTGPRSIHVALGLSLGVLGAKACSLLLQRDALGGGPWPHTAQLMASPRGPKRMQGLSRYVYNSRTVLYRVASFSDLSLARPWAICQCHRWDSEIVAPLGLGDLAVGKGQASSPHPKNGAVLPEE